MCAVHYYICGVTATTVHFFQLPLDVRKRASWGKQKAAKTKSSKKKKERERDLVELARLSCFHVARSYSFLSSFCHSRSSIDLVKERLFLLGFYSDNAPTRI